MDKQSPVNSLDDTFFSYKKRCDYKAKNTGRNLKIIFLSERCQYNKDTHCYDSKHDILEKTRH